MTTTDPCGPISPTHTNPPKLADFNCRLGMERSGGRSTGGRRAVPQRGRCRWLLRWARSVRQPYPLPRKQGGRIARANLAGLFTARAATAWGQPQDMRTAGGRAAGASWRQAALPASPPRADLGVKIGTFGHRQRLEALRGDGTGRVLGEGRAREWVQQQKASVSRVH